MEIREEYYSEDVQRGEQIIQQETGIKYWRNYEKTVCSDNMEDMKISMVEQDKWNWKTQKYGVKRKNYTKISVATDTDSSQMCEHPWMMMLTVAKRAA
jgi:hypothetical protein